MFRPRILVSFFLLSLPALSTETNCPAQGNTVDIRASGDAAVRRNQRQILKDAVARDNTTVRLGPDVDLDFSDLPASFFPIFLGRCVTLTSVASFGTAVLGTSAVVRRNPQAEISGSGPARGARSLGPVLRFGKHRAGAGSFLQIECFANGAANDGVKISGFRLIGPSLGLQETEEKGIHIVRCIDVEISNMEVSGWGGDAISVEDDPGPDHASASNAPGGRIINPGQILIHDNFLHNNQHPKAGSHAEGYGVAVGPGAWAKIYQNVFDNNRHSIAASGNTGGYWAEHNLVLKGGGYHGALFAEYTHSFDVHGTANCPEIPGESIPIWGSIVGGTHHIWNCGDAGIQFWYLSNAWQYRKDNDIKLRGKPAIGALIDKNVFPQSQGDAIDLNTKTNVTVGQNVSNLDTFGRYGVCDFDGDGVDDLFLATGASWWYSSFGEFQWTYLGPKNDRIENLRFGYFDADNRCDVLAEERSGHWVISSGGLGEWKVLGDFGAPLKEVQFGRFDPKIRDHRANVTLQTTHAFRRRADGQWFITPLARPNWQPAQSSSFPLSELRFGDFNGDGVTDVLAVQGGRWSISESGNAPWRRLNRTLNDPVQNLFIANMDADDNIDDILKLDRKISRRMVGSLAYEHAELTWYRSRNGVEPWKLWKTHTFDYPVVPDTVSATVGFAGRFGAAPGGGTLVIDDTRTGRFYSAAEKKAGANPDWSSVFQY